MPTLRSDVWIKQRDRLFGGIAGVVGDGRLEPAREPCLGKQFLGLVEVEIGVEERGVDHRIDVRHGRRLLVRVAVVDGADDLVLWDRVVEGATHVEVVEGLHVGIKLEPDIA